MSDEKIDDYFRLQEKVMKAMGISLYEENSLLYKFYSVCSIVFVVCMYTFVESYGMYVYYDDLDVFASILGLAATHILGMIKVFVLMKHKKQIQETLKSLEEGIFAPNYERGGDFEMQKIKECISTTQKHCFAYWTPATIVWAFVIAMPIITRTTSSNYKDWKTPAVPFALFELKRSPIFEIIAFAQGVCLTLFSYIISSTDLIIVGVIAHLKTQFKILKNSIGRVVGDARKMNGMVVEDENSEIPRQNLQKTLKKVIVYHQSIINLAEQFEDLFNYLILAVFVINTLILCFTMYHASLYPLSDRRSQQDFSYIVTISTQVFLYCYWGNELSLESQSVAMACYDVDFVGTYVGFQKALAIIMMRSQRPVVVTAGKFTTLSLMTFVGILRVSYSYYMVLRTSNEIQ